MEFTSEKSFSMLLRVFLDCHELQQKLPLHPIKNCQAGGGGEPSEEAEGGEGRGAGEERKGS